MLRSCYSGAKQYPAVHCATRLLLSRISGALPLLCTMTKHRVRLRHFVTHAESSRKICQRHMVIYKSTKYCCYCYPILVQIECNPTIPFKRLTICTIELHVLPLLRNSGIGSGGEMVPEAPIPQVLVMQRTSQQRYNHQ